MVLLASCEKNDVVSANSIWDIGQNPEDNGSSTGTGNNTNSSGSTTGSTVVIDDNYSDDVLTISDYTNVITITWNGTSATVSGADNLIACSVSGGHVTLGTSSSEVESMNIVLTGTGTDAGLKIYNGKKFVVSLSGADLTSKTGAVINSQSSKRMFVYLTSGTTNSLTDASSYTDVTSGEDCKGTLFSEGQIIITGTGSLSVTGNYKHGIVSDDYIRFYNGNVTVTSAASDAMHTNDYFRMDDGTLTLTADSDGIEIDEGYANIVGGSLTIKSGGEGIKTSYDDSSTDITPYISISGGTLNIATTESKGHGIKASGDVIISDGEITVAVSGSASKAIKSDSNIEISGGTLTLDTTGASIYDSDEQDTSSPSCLKADGTVLVSGGTIVGKSTGSGGKVVSADYFMMSGGSLSATTTGSYYRYNSSLSANPKAIKADTYLGLSGGQIPVITSGTYAEGIESKGSIGIIDGYVYVYSKADDAINSSGIYKQSGGYVYAYSAGNDAVDSNYGGSGAITVTGGALIAHGTTSPEEGIDADNLSYVSISGGTVFTSGGIQNSGTPSCTQPGLFLQSYSLSSGYFTVADSDGTVLFACRVPRTMSQCYSIITSSSMKSGSTYKYGLVSSKPTDATSSWGDYYYTGGTAGGTLSSSFTASSSISSSSGSAGGGSTPGGGGAGGGRR